MDVKATVGHDQDDIAGLVLWTTKDGVSKLRLICDVAKFKAPICYRPRTACLLYFYLTRDERS